jgi:hypothetical protein
MDKEIDKAGKDIDIIKKQRLERWVTKQKIGKTEKVHWYSKYVGKRKRESEWDIKRIKDKENERKIKR